MADAKMLKKVPVREQDPKVRATNFEEVCLGYNQEEAMEEAQRCLGCKKPKCVEGCQKDSQKHSQKKSCHNTHKTKSNRLPEIPGKTQFKKLSDNRNRRCQKDLLFQIHTRKLPDCNPEKHC